MFQAGKTYKAKIELATGESGFGRAAIVAKDTNNILVNLATSKDVRHVLPKGTKLFLVGDEANNLFNGLWQTEVIGVKIHGGKTVMVCSVPKFKAIKQQRVAERYLLQLSVDLVTERMKAIHAQSINISKTGIAIETNLNQLAVDQNVNMIMHSKQGDISANCRVVRVQNNWLSQNNIIGLEFLAIDPASKDSFEKLIVAAKDDLTKHVGLASWVHSSKDDTSMIKPSSPGNRKK